MITLRRSDERGQTKLDWLDSRHTFSFGEYHDRRYMGFRDLRVINEDRVSPGKGFGTHSHRDMEIITYVLEGSVEHKDSTGNQTIIRPGDVQRMSAGTGISHSEYNPSKTEPVHFLQIWILPERENLPPSYEQRAFDLEKNRGRWILVAAKDGRDSAVTVHQDVALSVARLLPGQQASYRLKPGRHAWLHAARGAMTLNGAALNEGDGAAVSAEEILEVRAAESAEILLFDLA
jgi:redox-sensitive bicupin YhaK (pirin superfamily)